MKKIVMSLVLAVAVLLPGLAFADANKKVEDGLYEVPVYLKHFHKDEKSMGNASLNQTAKATVKDGKATYTIYTKVMEMGNIKGELTNLVVFKDKADGDKIEVTTLPSDMEGFDKAFSFERALAGEEAINLGISVDIMKQMSGKEYEKVVLKIDWEKAKKVEMSDKKEEKVEEKKTGDVANEIKGDPSKIDIFVNGKVVESDVEPYITNGRTMVPVRFISEALGLKVEWDAETKTVIIGEGASQFKLTIDAMSLKDASGKEMALEAPAVLKNGRTMVPLRVIVELSGADIRWVGETKTIVIAK